MKQFTFEEFEGYTFNCEVVGANTGFKHVCEVVKDNNIILKTDIHYGNRTWESYQFESVLTKAKELLKDKLSNEVKPEINTDFLNTLANYDYIGDYAVMGGTDDEITILMDSWEQVRGRDRAWSDTKKCFVKCDVIPSVYAKLVSLAEKGLLKDDLNYTMLNTEYVFSDQYMICDDCGKLFDSSYGEIRYIESADRCLCEDCMASDDDVISGMIEGAIDSFNKAVPVAISENKLNELGYSELIGDLSLSYEQWGEKRFGYNYSISTDDAKNICNKFGGFAKLTSVQQFDCIYSVYVPTELLDEAKEYAGLNDKELVNS